MSSSIVIDVRRRFGAPCVEGTRIDPDLIVSFLLEVGYEKTLKSYPHLTRDNVLVACWYIARHGRPKDWKAEHRKRLRAWLDDAEPVMWQYEDWSEVPLP